ncbi:mannonate dehydratase [Rubinisphaera italica]|uniref:mannonate dehydratase n=1 Tax=Rubinisphaera italica TaxID=2527969 RepID=A0A5C5XEA1_9PLAN|nr:Mannonate dehydratase [Rubinisphaera italica]
MKRRSLLHSAMSITGVLGAAQYLEPLGQAARGRLQTTLQMQIGSQRGPISPEMLQFFQRYGVKHICGCPPYSKARGYWTVSELEQTRDLCLEYGISLDMVALPFLTSSHIDHEKRGAIMLGESGDRDRDIEYIQRMIACCAKVGIPAIKYNLSLLGVLRTKPTQGRGRSTYQSWKYSEAVPPTPYTRAGLVDEELAWERIEYFLKQIIPVCNEFHIRAACHPHDPGVPPEGYQGVCRVLGTVSGLKRLLSIQSSPLHGLNFCVGTVAEMLQDPAREILPIVQHFAQQKKIFNVHLRNIRGHRDDFQEVYVDEGDLDLFQILSVLKDAGYPYLVMPDHVPRHASDPDSLQAFAHSFGYIQGLLHSLD